MHTRKEGSEDNTTRESAYASIRFWMTVLIRSIIYASNYEPHNSIIYFVEFFFLLLYSKNRIVFNKMKFKFYKRIVYELTFSLILLITCYIFKNLFEIYWTESSSFMPFMTFKSCLIELWIHTLLSSIVNLWLYML